MNATPDRSAKHDSWLGRFVAGGWSDLRHAVRLLVKAPGFSIVILSTLALCIGANTAIFSMVDGLMLKPLPFAQPERIVEIYNVFPRARLDKLASNVVQYLDYKQHATFCERIGLWSEASAMFGADGAQERLIGAHATADMFEVLGLNPIVGRFFTIEHSRPQAEKVVVLSQSFWQSHFREDPTVVGTKIRLDGELFTVTGVAPRALEGFVDARVRFVQPLEWDPARVNPNTRFSLGLPLFARLKTGVTLAQARQEAQTIEQRALEVAAPFMRDFIERAGHVLAIEPVQTERIKTMESALYLLQGGVAFVLLIGCVNLANLQLVRANGRQAEIALRFALGASRSAVARQLLCESLFLTVLGAILGVGLAWGLIQAINHYTGAIMPQLPPIALDGRILGFTASVSLLVAAFIGVLPVVHTLRSNLTTLIHGSARGASGSARVRRLSGALVVAQVGVTLLPLTGAGLLFRSFAQAVAVHPGIDPRGVVTASISLPAAFRATDAAAQGLQERLSIALDEIAGVGATSMAFSTPFQGGLPVNTIHLFLDPFPAGSPQSTAYRVTVWPTYRETMKLSMLEGRFYTSADIPARENQKGWAPVNQKVWVVDESFAKKFFPGRSAVGGRFSFGGRPQKDEDWPTIVGVAKNVPHNGVEDRSGVPFVYQLPQGRPDGMTLFLRTDRPTSDIIAALREKIRQIDPTIPIYDTGELATAIDASFNQRRAVMLLLGAFGGLALFLAAVGIYGVLAYDVAQRTREIGIRGALGATRGHVVRMILRQGLGKVALGLSLGLVAAVGLSQTMTSLLFDVKPTDPPAYALGTMVLFCVAMLASYLPARRAAKIDPMAALRNE